MTVWAVNMSREHDISAAKQYGDIRYINTKYVYGDEIDAYLRMPGGVYTNLVVAASNFDPKNDYVLIYGDHLQLLAFVRSIGKVWDGPILVLRWDKKAEGYLPVVI